MISRILSNLTALSLLVFPTLGAAQAIDTAATTALVIDYQTGAVLLEKNADVPMPPASMSKLMTLNMLFEAVQSGRVELTDVFPVSTNAHGFGGSTMFLETRHSPTVEDLIRGIVVLSGNDACIVVAEHLAGSETAFARRMTERALELGMTGSTFANSTGWPHPDHRMSGRDLIFLADRMVGEFSEFYPYFAETQFTWNDIRQSNRNPLLGAGIGGDGLKTGHTEEAGYGLVGSAVQDGRRILFVISGLESSADRTTESQRIASWAFREFENHAFFEAGDVVAQGDVWMGEENTVPLIAAETVLATLPIGQAEMAVARVEYNAPLPAPIAQGDYMGDLVITTENVGEVRVPLIAGADVAEGGMFTRVWSATRLMASQAFARLASDDAETATN